MSKPVIVLDDDSDRINRFRLTLFPPENEAHRLIASLIKLEHPVWSLAQPETGVPRSVMSVGEYLKEKENYAILINEKSFLKMSVYYPLPLNDLGLVGNATSRHLVPADDCNVTVIVEDTTLLPGYGDKQV